MNFFNFNIRRNFNIDISQKITNSSFAKTLQYLGYIKICIFVVVFTLFGNLLKFFVQNSHKYLYNFDNDYKKYSNNLVLIEANKFINLNKQALDDCLKSIIHSILSAIYKNNSDLINNNNNNNNKNNNKNNEYGVDSDNTSDNTSTFTFSLDVSDSFGSHIQLTISNLSKYIRNMFSLTENWEKLILTNELKQSKKVYKAFKKIILQYFKTKNEILRFEQYVNKNIINNCAFSENISEDKNNKSNKSVIKVSAHSSPNSRSRSLVYSYVSSPAASSVSSLSCSKNDWKIENYYYYKYIFLKIISFPIIYVNCACFIYLIICIIIWLCSSFTFKLIYIYHENNKR